MIERIIHWVYCLPIPEALVLALVASGAFFWLYQRFSSRRWWRPFTLAVLIAWFAAVLSHTLLNRGTERITVSLIPFQTYVAVYKGADKELLRSAFMNVLMFYPGALLVRSLLPKWKWWLVLLMFLLTSVAIEGCQYYFQLGFVEVDDVLHNTLGAGLGLVSFRQYQKHHENPKG